MKLNLFRGRCNSFHIPSSWFLVFFRFWALMGTLAVPLGKFWGQLTVVSSIFHTAMHTECYLLSRSVKTEKNSGNKSAGKLLP